ncbi:hypothetical protein ABBQ32_009811 [Trebouxia sp. C0010 RCD-2024]
MLLTPVAHVSPAECSTAAVVKEQEAAGSRKAGASSAPPAQQGLISTQPPRGTRDFHPEEMRQRNWLFDHMEAVSRVFAFEQVDAPVLESEELFVRKAGEEITDQLYNFEDKGGRRMALRPEFTPSLARMVLQKGKGLPLPVKWFTLAQCWRFERSTRGRRREHYQWNMDCIGVAGVEAEAELLAAMVMFFQRVGLSSRDVAIKISSRQVLQAVLVHHQIPAEFTSRVFVTVDKMDKLPQETVETELKGAGLNAEAISGIMAAMQVRSLSDLEILLGSDDIAVQQLQRLFELAGGYGFDDWLVFDASIVRGLAYYTGIVFEARDRKGELRAIAGGGRYDQLLQTFGGQQQPCAGFGFGDAVIMELLKDLDLLPHLQHKVQDVVVVMDEGLRSAACDVAMQLRQAGRSVDVILESKKMKQVFKVTERMSAERLLIVAPKEWEAGRVRVKSLDSREESDVVLADLIPQSL